MLGAPPSWWLPAAGTGDTDDEDGEKAIDTAYGWQQTAGSVGSRVGEDCDRRDLQFGIASGPTRTGT